MGEKQQNTIVGVFVLMGIVVLAVLVMAFGGGRTIFTNTYDLQVDFPKGVQGIQEGQTVTLSGKRIGVTKEVRFADDNNLQKGVVVVVSVEEFAIPQASEMVVAPNMMGIGKPPVGIVVTDPLDTRRVPMDGTGRISGRVIPMLDQLIPQKTQATFEDASRHIGELAAALKPAALNLERLLESRGMSEVDAHSVTANLDTLIQRFDATLRSINTIVSDEQQMQNLRQILANTNKMSDAGVEVMENARDITGEGKEVTKELVTLLRSMAAATNDLSAVLQRLDQTIGLLQQKTGTFGKLMTDDRLYEELLLSARRLTKMLDDMREVLDLAKRGELRIKAF